MRGELHSLQWRESGLTVRRSRLKRDESDVNLSRTPVINPSNCGLSAGSVIEVCAYLLAE